MDIPDDVFDEMARDTTAPKRVPCAACGTWTCLECGYVRLHANRYSSKPQTCSDCGSAEGIMEPAGHQKDKRILNHAAKVRRMTSEGVSPRYPLEGFDYGYAKDACVTEGASSPDVPTRRWLVEARPPFHRTDGPFEDVGAAFFGIEDGCLIFRDNRGEIIYARAAGTWLTCVPEEN